MQIKVEAVADLGLLGCLLKETKLSERFDKIYPRHHLWQGISAGKLLEGLMHYILSENDHRLSHIESWASGLEYCLSQILEVPNLHSSEFNDDRLGNLLDMIAHDDNWITFLKDSNDTLIRVYDLRIKAEADSENLLTARLDMTSAQSDRLPEGLFQHGYNAHGSDFPQVKCSLLSVDFANFPVCMQVVSGEQADDCLYLPLLKQAQRVGLPESGVLLVGDTKLCSENNLAEIAEGGNYYLTPLAQKHMNEAELLKAVEWIYTQVDTPYSVTRVAAQGEHTGIEKEIAWVKELPSRVFNTSLASGKEHQHQQRLIAYCSLASRAKQLAALASNIEKAPQAVQDRFIVSRGRKTIKNLDEALEVVQKILKQNSVIGLFECIITPPTEPNKGCTIVLKPLQNEIDRRRLACGWRVLVTNAPDGKLSQQKAVLCYWDEYLVEQQFHLLLNKCSALMPIYLKKENRVKALARILFLAVQHANLYQHRLRENLAKNEQKYLTNIIPGNPGMKMFRPTTQAVLRAFKSLSLVIITMPDGQDLIQLSGFNDIHRTILKLLNVPEQTFLHTICQRTG